MSPERRTAEIEVSHRPLRLAFLVSSSDIDDVLTAVRYSTILWGGLRHLILPVDDEGDLLGSAHSFLQAHDPDVFCWLREPDTALQNSLQDAYAPFLFTSLGVTPPDAKLQIDPFLGIGHGGLKPDHRPPSEGEPYGVVLADTVGLSAYNIPLALQFGLLTEGDVDSIPLQFGLRGLGPDAGIDDYFRSTEEASDCRTAIHATTHCLTETFHDPSLLPRVVVVGEPHDPVAACLFWCLRATMMSGRGALEQTLFLPRSVLEDNDAFEQFVTRLSEDLDRHQTMFAAELEVSFVGDSDTQEAVTEALQSLPDQVRVWHSGESSTYKMGTDLPPREAGSPLVVAVGTLTAPRRVTISSGSVPALVASDDRAVVIPDRAPDCIAEGTSGNIVLDLAKAPQLRLPRCIDVASFTHSHSHVRMHHAPWYVSALRSASRGEALRIELPDDHSILYRALSRASVEVTPSSTAVRVMATMDALGGLAGVLQTLRRPEAVEYLSRLTPSTSDSIARKLANELNVSRDVASASLQEGLSGIDLDAVLSRPIERAVSEFPGPNDESLEVLDVLARAGMLIQGLRLRCPHCACDDFYALDDIGGICRCTSCRRDFRMSVKDTGAQPSWRFRLSSVHYPLIAGGVLSVVLTAAVRAKASMDCFYWYPGFEFTPPLKGIGEVDLVYISDGRLGIAECKTTGPLSPDRITHIIDLAREIRAEEVIFATCGEFTDESSEAMAEHTGWMQGAKCRMPLVLPWEGKQLLNEGSARSPRPDLGSSFQLSSGRTK